MARRPGKYAHITPKLPRVFEDPARQAKLDEIKAIVRGSPEFKQHASFLALQWSELRAEKDDLKARLKAINLHLDALKQMIIDQYEVESVTLERLNNHKSVGLQWEPYAKLVDINANRRWAIQMGLEHKLRLPWVTLNALTKEIVLAGDKEPDGVEVKSLGKLVLREW